MADDTQNASTPTPNTGGGMFGKLGGRLKEKVGKGFSAITPKVTQVASQVGDKLESTADKITSKIPGGEGFKDAASNAIEKGVNKIGEETKEMVEKGKGYVNNKVDQGQAAAEKKSGSLLGEISDKIQKTAEQGVGAVTGAVGQAGDALGSGVTMAQDAAKQWVAAVQDGVKQVQETATNVAQEAQKQATNVATQVQDKTTEAVETVQEKAENAVETAQSTIQAKATDVVTEVKDKAVEAKDKVAEVATNVKDKATEKVEAVTEKVEEKVAETPAEAPATPEAPAAEEEKKAE